MHTVDALHYSITATSLNANTEERNRTRARQLSRFYRRERISGDQFSMPVKLEFTDIIAVSPPRYPPPLSGRVRMLEKEYFLVATALYRS